MRQTVLIVDDHEGFRRSARRLLEAEGYLVVGEAADGAAALGAAERLRPDLVLLDVVLPGLDGFQVAERLAALPSPPVVVLTSSRQRGEFGPRMDRSPARGFLHKGELSGAALAALAGRAPGGPEPAQATRPLEGQLQAELEALGEREQRHRALLDALPDLMFRFDAHGTYLEAHAPNRDDLLTAPDGELVGHSVHEILPAEVAERFLALVPEVLAGGVMRLLEFDLPMPQGRRSFEARIVRCGQDQVLAIVRNITERKRAEAELRASRARIVEAADAERRRLERDLHDGAQQRLLGARLALRLARDRLQADAADGLDGLLAEADQELGQAVEELRALAHGIHPAVLTDEGLAAALEVLARRAAVPVELVGGPPGRLPASVEAAAYFVASEALANVGKHARASRAIIAVGLAGGRLSIEVADDGVGGADPARGSGLRGLCDRVEALGGGVRIQSPPGGGTRLRAELPCG
jgi:signal transduction histidine kinase